MEIKPTLTDKQKIALLTLINHNNGISEVLYGGSAGNGKSYIGCMWLLMMALQYPGTRYLIGRSKLATLKTTTLNTFFDVAASLGVANQFNYNGNNNIITFNNGSEIILKDLFYYPSDPYFDSIGSLEITAAFIDECNQVTEKAKNIVMSRIRYKLDENNLSPKILMTCNPAKNWVYNEFYKKDKEGTIEPYKKFIKSLVSDNPFISKHYVDNLKKLDELSKQRLLYGQWEYEDDYSLFKYDAIINSFDAEAKNGKHYLTIDVARLGKDSTIILLWNGLNVIKTYEIERATLDKQITLINNIKNKYNIRNVNICVDSDGVGGGVADMIPHCTNINNGVKPLKNENYQNLKTQLYFKLADYINGGEIGIHNMSVEHKEKLIQELNIIKREAFDTDGKVKMTSKIQMKKAIGRSPDISDALAYRMIWEIKNTEYNIQFSFI